jgi:hypothetical protein
MLYCAVVNCLCATVTCFHFRWRQRCFRRGAIEYVEITFNVCKKYLKELLLVSGRCEIMKNPCVKFLYFCINGCVCGVTAIWRVDNKCFHWFLCCLSVSCCSVVTFWSILVLVCTVNPCVMLGVIYCMSCACEIQWWMQIKVLSACHLAMATCRYYFVVIKIDGAEGK